MVAWPTRGQKAPNFWDEQLKQYVDAIGSGVSSSLLVVSGGTVDLDNTKPDGYLIGYKVTGTTVIEGQSFAAGSYIFERDSTVATGWSYRTLAASTAVYTGPADTTPPVAGTLASSAITTNGFTLTVTGASDAGALATAPYSFSTDNGTTWSAYQSAAVYTATGLTASTAYTAKHRVKDAAGNVTVGTGITVTTTAPVPTAVTETFTLTDGTTMNGRTSTTGAATLISPARSINAGNNATDAPVTGNKIVVVGATDGLGVAILTAQQNYEVSIDYVIATADTAHQARVVARAALADDNGNGGNSIILAMIGNGSLRWEESGGIGGTLAASGIGLTGTLKLRAVGNTYSAFINGTQVGSSWTATRTGGYAIGGVYGSGTTLDNFGVTYL